MKRLRAIGAWICRLLAGTWARLPHPDVNDLLLTAGVGLVAWTVYLFLPAITPAFVGVSCVAISVLRELASGTHRKSADGPR